MAVIELKVPHASGSRTEIRIPFRQRREDRYYLKRAVLGIAHHEMRNLDGFSEHGFNLHYEVSKWLERSNSRHPNLPEDIRRIMDERAKKGLLVFDAGLLYEIYEWLGKTTRGLPSCMPPDRIMDAFQNKVQAQLDEMIALVRQEDEQKIFSIGEWICGRDWRDPDWRQRIAELAGTPQTSRLANGYLEWVDRPAYVHIHNV